MGLNWTYVRQLDHYGFFKAPGCRILDVGCSNLYMAPADDMVKFVREKNPSPRPDLEAFCEKLEKGSAFDPVTGGTNESFAGEIFEAAGFTYEAIDIAEGFNTTIVDLNHEMVPEEFVGNFDAVMNFGTTEHIFNQFNSFAAIHEATKAGGYIFHSLPSIGHTDHCYFTYNGRFFFDMAGYNNYKIVDMWFDGPAGDDNAFESVQAYSGIFPALKTRMSLIGANDRETAIHKLKIPNISICVLFQKMNDAPFRGAIETSTSAHAVSTRVLGDYSKLEVAKEYARRTRAMLRGRR